MPTIRSTPPRQCAAFSTSTDGLCLRDTFDVIEMGLSLDGRAWTVIVEVPVCDDHDDLKTAVSEEVNPTMGSFVGDLDDSTTVMPTFRMSVSGRAL